MNNKKKKMIETIIQEQWKLNDKTLLNWKQSLTAENWEQAILVEVGEALESAGYKWWKKQKIDIENIKIELIDILHFVASLIFYYPKKYDEFIDLFISGNINNNNKIVIDGKLNESNLASFRNILLSIGQFKTIETVAFDLGKAFSYIDLTIEEIFLNYIIKNVLNEFRQIKGYKQGNYKKTWKYKNEEVEDNVVAFKEAKNIDNVDNFKTELFNILEVIYQSQ